MRTCLRGAAVAVAALWLAVGLAACGEAGQPSSRGEKATGKGGMRIGLLLPDDHIPRFETFDRPLMEKKIKELCGGCTVVYANAQGDVGTQRQQVDTMLARRVDVLVLAAIDSKSIRSSVKEAHEADIPVVAYDRLAEGPISAYVSFAPERVGRLQAQALLKAMGNKAHGGQIVMMNGSSTDPNAIGYTRGALSVFQGKVRIGKAYDTFEWRPEHANVNMSGAIAALGAEGIDGVYAANDGIASGVINALKAAHITPLPPVTGQDAELAAMQRIVAGDQYMSIYKPFTLQAASAAETAVALGRGEKLDRIATDHVSSPTTKNVPAVLLTPVSVTVHNIKGTVVKDGVYTIEQICTPKYKAACDRAGLTR